MKKTLLTLTIICACIAANAQNRFNINRKKNGLMLPQKNFALFTPQPQTLLITDPNTGKSLIALDFKKDSKSVGFSDWDMIQINIKKSHFYWLNDSTAIYIKPSK